MNTTTEASHSSRSRAEILGAIAAIPHAVQGKICEMHKALAGGRTATYYNLQYWAEGKNHSIHVPREKLAEFNEAVEDGRKLRLLVTELGEEEGQEVRLHQETGEPSRSRLKLAAFSFDPSAPPAASAALRYSSAIHAVFPFPRGEPCRIRMLIGFVLSFG